MWFSALVDCVLEFVVCFVDLLDIVLVVMIDTFLGFWAHACLLCVYYVWADYLRFAVGFRLGCGLGLLGEFMRNLVLLVVMVGLFGWL